MKVFPPPPRRKSRCGEAVLILGEYAGGGFGGMPPSPNIGLEAE